MKTKTIKIGKAVLKHDERFGSYFGTMPAEPYDTGRDHFKPRWRSIYISREMYPGTSKSFYYITSSIKGSMRTYRSRSWYDTEVGNIFASGKTLREALTKFRHNLANLKYNRRR